MYSLITVFKLKSVFANFPMPFTPIQRLLFQRCHGRTIFGSTKKVSVKRNMLKKCFH